MKDVTVYTVNAFTINGQGGNPAGVVLEAEGLSREQKQHIATAVNYSETVYVTPKSSHCLQLEYFTPVAEVPLCGHATIATFVLLHSMKRIAAGDYTIQTLSGELTIQVEPSGKVFMQQCIPTFFEQYEAQDFASCIPAEIAECKMPIQAVSTGLKDIIYPVGTTQQLAELTPDFNAMALLNKKQQAVGIHAFALTDKNGVTAICRNFAPAYGVDEESATGTANCALACYLLRHYKPLKHYTFEQGHQLGKPSRIEVDIHNDGSPFVGGYGKVIKSDQIEADEK